jgi:delta-aminolevulinic acid dehydratase/porphobilinogen synthase
LTTWNGTLKSELDQLKKDCKAMEAENTRLMVNTTRLLYSLFAMPSLEKYHLCYSVSVMTIPTVFRLMQDKMLRRDDKILQPEGCSVITTLSIQVEASKSHHGGNIDLHKNTTDTDSKG